MVGQCPLLTLGVYSGGGCSPQGIRIQRDGGWDAVLYHASFFFHVYSILVLPLSQASRFLMSLLTLGWAFLLQVFSQKPVSPQIPAQTHPAACFVNLQGISSPSCWPPLLIITDFFLNKKILCKCFRETLPMWKNDYMLNNPGRFKWKVSIWACFPYSSFSVLFKQISSVFHKSDVHTCFYFQI